MRPGIRRCGSSAGYAANVRACRATGFALLGNAAEFLDPVFSSGVTIAMRSASMAAATLERELAGEAVDWSENSPAPSSRGVDSFRAYVTAWYDGRFQRIIFARNKSPTMRRMICSILAGYAWDETNPFAMESERRLDALRGSWTRDLEACGRTWREQRHSRMLPHAAMLDSGRGRWA